MKIDRKTSFLDLSDNPLSAKAVVGVVAAARKQVNACTHVYTYASIYCVYIHRHTHACMHNYFSNACPNATERASFQIGSMPRTQTRFLPEMSRIAMSRTHHCRIVNRMLCLALCVGAEAHQDAQLKKHIRT